MHACSILASFPVLLEIEYQKTRKSLRSWQIVSHRQGPFLLFKILSQHLIGHTPRENLRGAQSTGLVFSVLSIYGLQVYVYELQTYQCVYRGNQLSCSHMYSFVNWYTRQMININIRVGLWTQSSGTPIFWFVYFLYIPNLDFSRIFLYLSLISPGGSYIEMGWGERGGMTGGACRALFCGYCDKT